jgi:hypothetical protein
MGGEAAIQAAHSWRLVEGKWEPVSVKVDHNIAKNSS